MNVTLYHAAIDPEGSTMAMGWDMNLDGSIDIPVSTNSGFTSINIPLNQWHDIPGQKDFQQWRSLPLMLWATIGIAVIGRLFHHTSRTVVGSFVLSGKDAQGTPGAGDADNLIMLTMDQGGDINWAAVSVKLSFGSAAP